jgi:hypothetical protein
MKKLLKNKQNRIFKLLNFRKFCNHCCYKETRDLGLGKLVVCLLCCLVRNCSVATRKNAVFLTTNLPVMKLLLLSSNKPGHNCINTWLDMPEKTGLLTTRFSIFSKMTYFVQFNILSDPYFSFFEIFKNSKFYGQNTFLPIRALGHILYCVQSIFCGHQTINML